MGIQGEVLTQIVSSSLTSTTPTPKVVVVSTQMPVMRSMAESILVMVYNLATEKFREVLHPSTITQNSNPPPLEHIPSVPVRQDILGPMWGKFRKFIWDQKRLANSPYHSSYTCPHHQNRRTTPSCYEPPCHGDASVGYRAMLMGTTLPHLQEWWRAWRWLGYQYAEPTKNAPPKHQQPQPQVF